MAFYKCYFIALALVLGFMGLGVFWDWVENDAPEWLKVTVIVLGASLGLAFLIKLISLGID